MSTTNVRVQVIAAGGKYIGDDIGGAEITIRDVRTREILASGITQGGSGLKPKVPDLMCVTFPRTGAFPFDSSTSAFQAALSIKSPTQIEVVAFGPLGARGSANTASATAWVYPGKDMTAGNGILLQMPGLICQILNPPTHTVWTSQVPDGIQIVTNIAMMCGCPISDKKAGAICSGDASSQPWPSDDFEVKAIIPTSKTPVTVDLKWTPGAPPGCFTGSLQPVSCFPAGNYPITVYAQQTSTGNTGVDISTFVVKDPPSPPPSS